MVSINLKEDVLEIMCSVEMNSRGVSNEESACVLSMSREGRGLRNSTAPCLAWQVSISPIWGIILSNMCMCLTTWYEDIGSSINHSL